METDERGYISFQLQVMGTEILSFRLDVDDFKTKWALIALGFMTSGVFLTPTIQGFFQ